MDKITLMISSVGKGLEAERDAIQKAFQHNELVELQGVAPYNSNSFASSSSLETIKIAEDCDLYILVLTEIFGFELEDGKSATEVEFDAAFRKDPTKVLVFLKDFGDVKIDEKQKAFIDKVSNYYTGYWRSTFKYSHELQGLVTKSFFKWLKNRASLGVNQTYLDHFVRLAKQIKPEPHAQVYYKVTTDLVELEYIFFSKNFIIHFSAEEIYKNFWGCVSKLQINIREWTR